MATFTYYYNTQDPTKPDNCTRRLMRITIAGEEIQFYVFSKNLGQSVTNGSRHSIVFNFGRDASDVEPWLFKNALGAFYTPNQIVTSETLWTTTHNSKDIITWLYGDKNVSVSICGYNSGNNETPSRGRAKPVVFFFNEYDNKYITFFYLSQVFAESSGVNFASFTTEVVTNKFVKLTMTGFVETAGNASAYLYPNDYTALLSDAEEIITPTDPYSGAGDSGTGGGDGTFDGSSDPVPVPSLPSIGATDTGFISLFVPSASQIRQVASYLWGPLWDIDTFKRLFEDPMDCILGLSVVPVSVPTSGSAQLTVGNVELSGITLPLASQQYVEVDCGTVDFTRRYFGSYLDFEPYTKMSIFVPYSGVHAVSADDIIGKVVGLKYHIDILTGSLVAFLTCGNSVLYEFNGACASNIPVNSMNYASTIENAIRIAVNIGTTVATAGAAAPATAAGEGAKLAVSGAEVGRAIALGGSTAQGALSLKPSIDRAGSLGGTTGLMGNQIPYFIITRPRMCKPKNQDVFQGYPSFIQTTLGDMEGTGFTAFENVILAGSYLTDTEKSELESILTAGVYL